MSTSKLKDEITSADFGVPVEFVELTENYANFARFKEREKIMKQIDGNLIWFLVFLAFDAMLIFLMLGAVWN